ncbi:MAG: cytochrome c peroxidase [Planctomycetota bacterium]|jgi:cytochrome c peroxidase
MLRSRQVICGSLLLAACGANASHIQRDAAREAAIPSLFSEQDLQRILKLSPLGPPEADPTNTFADDSRAAAFGQALFFDERLSKKGDRSCASCHDAHKGWADGLQLGQGVTQLNRNTMSLWNVAYNRWQFWDGRADSLWAQALQPLENPLEHAFTRLQVAHVIAADSALASRYEAIFGQLPALEEGDRFPAVGRPVPKGEGHAHVEAAPPADAKSRGLGPRRGHVHAPGQGFYHPHQRAWDSMHRLDQDAVTAVFVNVGKAIAAFERKIVSRLSPFDVFIEGLRERDADKLQAISTSAQRGLKIFVDRGKCFLCHSGPTLSDLEFHDVGVPQLDPEMPADEGRVIGMQLVAADPFNGVGDWSDDPGGTARLKIDYLPTHAHHRTAFKTPSLRNVRLTAPYHHQGQFATLEEVVDFYSTRQGARTRPPMTETLIQPLNLSQQESADLVAFLHSLTDDSIAEELTRAPE